MSAVTDSLCPTQTFRAARDTRERVGENGSVSRHAKTPNPNRVEGLGVRRYALTLARFAG